MRCLGRKCGGFPKWRKGCLEGEKGCLGDGKACLRAKSGVWWAKRSVWRRTCVFGAEKGCQECNGVFGAQMMCFAYGVKGEFGG